jgi:hypothetical protein
MLAKDKLNRLKRRQWYRSAVPAYVHCRICCCRYRPVAPVMTHDFASVELGPISSPHMQFAPAVPKKLQALMPAAMHLDSTCRIQTLTSEQEPWLS